MHQTQERRSQTVIDPGGGEREELLEGNDSQDRYETWEGIVPTSHSHSRASVRQHTNEQAVGPVYPERKDQGQYPVVVVLHGTQHRKDSELWIRNGMKHRRGGDSSRNN